MSPSIDHKFPEPFEVSWNRCFVIWLLEPLKVVSLDRSLASREASVWVPLIHESLTLNPPRLSLLVKALTRVLLPEPSGPKKHIMGIFYQYCSFVLDDPCSND